MTLREYLNNWIKTESDWKDAQEEDIKDDIYSVLQDFMWEIQDKIINYPQIKERTGGSEPVDLENMEVVSFSKNNLGIVAGGDWQEPYVINIKFEDPNFTCTFSRKLRKNEEYPDTDVEKIYNSIRGPKYLKPEPADNFNPLDPSTW